MPNTKSVKEAYRDRTVIHPMSSFQSKNVAKAYKDRSVIHPMSSFQSQKIAKAYKDRSVIYPMSAFSKNKTSKPVTKTFVPLPPSNPKPAPTFPVVPNPINATIQNLGRSIAPTIPSRVPTPPTPPPQPPTNRLPSPEPTPTPTLSNFSIPTYLPPHPLDLGRHLPSTLPAPTPATTDEAPIDIWITEASKPQPTNHEYTVTYPSTFTIQTIQKSEPQDAQPLASPQPYPFFSGESEAAFRKEIEAMFDRGRAQPAPISSAKKHWETLTKKVTQLVQSIKAFKNVAPKNNPVSPSSSSALEAAILKKDQEQVKELSDISQMLDETGRLLASANQHNIELQKMLQVAERDLLVRSPSINTEHFIDSSNRQLEEAEERNKKQLLKNPSSPKDGYILLTDLTDEEYAAYLLKSVSQTPNPQSTSRQKDSSPSYLQALGNKASSAWKSIKSYVGFSDTDKEKTRFPLKMEKLRRRQDTTKTRVAARVKPTTNSSEITPVPRSNSLTTHPSSLTTAQSKRDRTKAYVEGNAALHMSLQITKTLRNKQSEEPTKPGKRLRGYKQVNLEEAQDSARLKTPSRSIPAPQPTYNIKPFVDSTIQTPIRQTRTSTEFQLRDVEAPKAYMSYNISSTTRATSHVASSRKPWILPPKSTTAKNKPDWNPTVFTGPRKDAIVLTSSSESPAAPTKASDKKPSRWILPPKSTAPIEKPVWNPNILLGTRTTSSPSDSLRSPSASGNFEDDYLSTPPTVFSKFTESTNELLEPINRNLSRADARAKTARLMAEGRKQLAALTDMRAQYTQRFPKQKQTDQDSATPPTPQKEIVVISSTLAPLHVSSSASSSSTSVSSTAPSISSAPVEDRLEEDSILDDSASTTDYSKSTLVAAPVSSSASSSSTSASTMASSIPSATFIQPSRLVVPTPDPTNQPPRVEEAEEIASPTPTNQPPAVPLVALHVPTPPVRANGSNQRTRQEEPSFLERLFGTTKSNGKWWSGIRSHF